MIRKIVPIYSAAWRALVILLTVEIAAVSALRYFTGSEPGPPPVLANAFAKPFLIIHVIGGVTALVVGPIQFARQVRARWPQVHRLTGRLYVAACAIGAPAGFMLALGRRPVQSRRLALPFQRCSGRCSPGSACAPQSSGGSTTTASGCCAPTR
jgi:hypothetical protein